MYSFIRHFFKFPRTHRRRGLADLITYAAIKHHAPRGCNLAAVLCLYGAFDDDIAAFYFFALLLFHNLFIFTPFIGLACCPFLTLYKCTTLFYIIQTFYKLFAEKTHFFSNEQTAEFRTMQHRQHRQQQNIADNILTGKSANKQHFAREKWRMVYKNKEKTPIR